MIKFYWNYHMRPYILVFLLSSCIAIGCEDANSKENPTFETVPTGFGGCWVNEKYLDTLLLTKSPKAAQAVDGITMLMLPDSTNKEMTIIWGFHEGVRDTLRMVNGKLGVYARHENTLVYPIQMVDDKIKLSNKAIEDEFIRLKDCIDNASQVIAHPLLFTGKYDLDGQQVIFSNSGKITGLGAFSYYDVFMDYNDAGMQVDQVKLGSNESDAKSFGFAFSGDTLNIYHLNCLEDQEDHCLIVENGKVMYQLVKKDH